MRGIINWAVKSFHFALLMAAMLVVLPAVALGRVPPGITDLGELQAGWGSIAYGVSADGSVVVGGSGDSLAFRWTPATGMVSLGALHGGGWSWAHGVSADGTVVVGFAADGAAGNAVRAFRWQGGVMESLGVLNLGPSSHAHGVSADGNVVVGFAADGAAGGATRAFRWTAATGMVSLGVLPGGWGSLAMGVNADGSVVVGEDNVAGALRAFRWTPAGRMESLGVLSGGFHSVATGVSVDGTVVVGRATDGAAGNAWRAFRWTREAGMVSLGVLNNGVHSHAFGVSADGSVVVGRAYDGAVAGNPARAFRWTAGTGMQSVEDWLRAAGVIVPVDITREARGVNADGSVVVGVLTSGFAFIARDRNGLVTLDDLAASLSDNAMTPGQASAMWHTVFTGVHSRPLARRVQAGQSSFWTAGDIGRDDHGIRDGSFGLAEVGASHAFAQGVQGTLSVGRVSSRQNLVFGGRSKLGTYYGTAGLLVNMPGTNLWTSAMVLYQRGDAEVRRGYLNAGVQDFSSGKPDVKTTALRLRLDRENAAHLGNATLTPYVDVTHGRTRIDGYTETGGGFPARFDARTERSTIASVGVDATQPLSANTKLLGRLEAAHRFEKTGAATSGTVLGLSSFSLPGEQVNRNWLRAGAGFETKLGGGTLGAMLNATNQGAAPNYWLNASWQMAF